MLIFTFYLIITLLSIFFYMHKKSRSLLDKLEIHNYNNFNVILMLLYIYTSVVIVVGVPGLTYNLGFSGMWTVLITASSGYVPFLFLGKRLAKIANAYKANNFIDLLEFRYNSSFLGLLTGLLCLMLLLLLMVTQLIGIKYFIDIATGDNSYFYIYVFLVAVYFTVIGVRSINYINIILSFFVFLISCFLVVLVIKLGGGLSNIKENIYNIDMQYFSPLGPESYKISYFYIFSYWIYLGFGVLGMPTVSYRAVLYRQSMKAALLAGTIIIFIITFNMAFVGFLSIPLLGPICNSDEALPLIIKYFISPEISFIICLIILSAFLGAVKLQLITVDSINQSIFNKIYPVYKKDMTIIYRGSILLFLAVATYFAANYKLNLFNIILITVGGFAASFTWTIFFTPFKYKFVNKGAAVVSIIFGLFLYSFIFNLESNWRSYIYPASLPVVLGLFAYIISGYLYYFFTKILFRIIT